MKKVITSIHFLLIYALIFMFSTHAQAEDSVEQLNQFNQPNFGFPKKECQHCLNYVSDSDTVLTPKQENELFQKCAVDLCGPAKENPRYIFDNATVNKKDIDPDTIKRFNERIRSTVEKAIQAELDYDRQILDILEYKKNKRHFSQN